MKKLAFIAGIAVGYVLGARAGRKRYEQIRKAAQNVWEMDTVQRGVHQAQEFAKERVGDVADTVYEGAKKVVGAVVSKADTSGAKTTGPAHADDPSM